MTLIKDGMGNILKGHEKKKGSQQLSSFMDIKFRGRVGTTPPLYSDNIKVVLKKVERQDVGRRPAIFD